jgi:hypothetical protein
MSAPLIEKILFIDENACLTAKKIADDEYG